MSWLDKYFASITTVQVDGVPVPQQPNLDFPGATVVDDPTNNVTHVTIPSSGGSGAQTVITGLTFTRPALNATSVATVSDTTQAVPTATGTTIGGHGPYLVTARSAESGAGTVTVYNAGGDSGSGTVAAGAIVTFGVGPLPFAQQQQGIGTVQANVGGLSTPYQIAPLYWTDLATKVPDNTRQAIHIDGYASDRTIGSAGIVHWKTNNRGTLAGNVTPTNLFTTVTFASTQTLAAGTPLVFASDPTRQYLLASAMAAATSGTLTHAYQGTTGATTATWGSATKPGIIQTVDIPTGGPVGAWVRDLSSDPGVYDPLWSGAYGDGVTDDWATIQTVINFNEGADFNSFKAVRLSPAHIIPGGGSGDNPTPATYYAISQPLNINTISGNSTRVLYGTDRASVWLCPTTTNSLAAPLSNFNTAWQGPLICDGDFSSAPTYVADSYGGSNMTACVVSCPSMASSSVVNLSQYDYADINGATLFCVEFLWNPLGSSIAGGTILAECRGSDGLITGYAWSVQRTGSSGEVTAFVTTTGSGRVTVHTASGHDLTANAMNHIALTYDGTNVRLFLNGAQPDSTMTAAATGTIQQLYCEEVVFGSSGYEVWPGFGQANPSDANFHLGVIRMSTGTARYTAPFSPTVANVRIVDVHTNCMVDFANQPTAPGMGQYILGTCGLPYFGQTRNTPSWLRIVQAGFNYNQGFTRIHGLGLYCPQGRAIQSWSSLYLNYYDLYIRRGIQGINLDGYSYNAHIGDDIFFFQTGLGGFQGQNSHSWNILFGNGCQFSKVGATVNTSFSLVQWHIVHTFGDVTCDSSWVNSVNQGMFYSSAAAGGIDLGSLGFTDEGAIIRTGVVLLNGTAGNGGASLRWPNGLVVIQSSAVPLVKVVQAFACDVGVTFFNYFAGASMFSFAPSALAPQNGGLPVYASGNLHNAGKIIDDTNGNFGPVIVPRQETFGIPHTVSFTANANLALVQADQLWGSVQVNDGFGISTPNLQVIVPLPIAGYRREVFNNAPQAINYGYAGGTNVAVGAGKTATIKSVCGAVLGPVYAAASNGGLIELEVLSHGLSTGAYVAVAGVAGTVEANGAWTVTATDANHITLQGSTFTNAYVASVGTVVSHWWRRVTADV
jgi:Concanavalin A-like lectin/glucanases superfamily